MIREAPPYDLLIVGGGVTGAGIARDAAGRGLRALLAEAGDLAGQTSSASTKLIHGGLRYLEYYEFRLVREALRERERLLRVAPHLVYPLTFVLPRPPNGRPGWLIRLGLLLYDNLGGGRTLPGSRGVKLAGTPLGQGLKPHVARGFSYADCWVDDARLVALLALDARERGAEVLTRTRVTALRRGPGTWTATLRDEKGWREVAARAVVTAAGGAGGAGGGAAGTPGRHPRLVKGSHIVVPRLFAGDHAFILQNPDTRIVFAIPYEGDYTLIGTTDVPWTTADGPARIDAHEVAYLCESANRYLRREIGPGDVVHSYSGVRPLFDDGADDASAVTRDYVLELSDGPGAPMLSVFGGKITTFRRLAEQAVDKLRPHLPDAGAAWTGAAPLPGGDIGAFDSFLAAARARWPFLPAPLARRLAHAYGSRLERVLGDAADLDDLGPHYGAGLHERELAYLEKEEWALTAEDVLWRRTKLGLHMSAAEVARVEKRMSGATAEAGA